jgi:phage-related protein
MKQDILNFDVRFYSENGETSSVLDFLMKLCKSNKNLAKKAVGAIFALPQNLFLFQNVKHFKVGKYKFYELRVKKENNICRFFFTIENPNLIVIHGFTKKSQKTASKDLETGINNLQNYQNNPKSIALPKILLHF